MGATDKLRKLSIMMLIFALFLSIMPGLEISSDINSQRVAVMNDRQGESQTGYDASQNTDLNIFDIPYYLRDFSMEDIKYIDVQNLTEEEVQNFRNLIAARNKARNKSMLITVSENGISFGIGDSISK
ncbi:MAG TPA: hypothetical protein VIO58_14660 [Candidatus Methanoperedens sp.]